MKKIFVTIAIAMASVVAANAQFSIGGDLGFNYESSENGSTTLINSLITPLGDESSAWSVSVNPKVGYDLSDKMTVGAYLGISYASATSNAKGLKNKDQEVSELGWHVSPFLRYNCVKFGKFGVALEGVIGINGASYTNENLDAEPSSFGFGINVTPFLTYDLNSNWSLETGLNFLSLGYNYNSYDADVTGVDDVTSSKFGLGVDANNVATLGAITIGAVYRF